MLSDSTKEQLKMIYNNVCHDKDFIKKLALLCEIFLVSSIEIIQR